MIRGSNIPLYTIRSFMARKSPPTCSPAETRNHFTLRPPSGGSGTMRGSIRDPLPRTVGGLICAASGGLCTQQEGPLSTETGSASGQSTHLESLFLDLLQESVQR